ncbi:SMODS domain-containing nucleotidyltransferase [Streptomyces olivaceus]
MTDQITYQFEDFLQRITLSDTEKLNALKQGQRLARRIEQRSEVRECLITGSMVRSTAIRKFSDVDIVAVMEPGDQLAHSEPAALVSAIARILREMEPDVQVSENAVRVTLMDGRVVDVLASVHLGINAEGDEEYRIPTARQEGWETYAPEAQNRRIREATQLLGEDFKRLIRLCKWWSKTHRQPISSHEIEIAAYETFPRAIPELSRAVVEFSDSLRRQIEGSSPAQAELLNFNRLAREAYDKQTLGDIQKSSELWGRIFGDEFTAVIT